MTRRFLLTRMTFGTENISMKFKGGVKLPICWTYRENNLMIDTHIGAPAQNTPPDPDETRDRANAWPAPCLPPHRRRPRHERPILSLSFCPQA